MVSLGYSGRVWCAAARSQSGAVSAKTRGENQLRAAASVVSAATATGATVGEAEVGGPRDQRAPGPRAGGGPGAGHA